MVEILVDIYLVDSTEYHGFQYPTSFLDGLRRKGLIQGLLADELECPPVVRVFLESFAGLRTLLWVKGEDLDSKLTESDFNGMSFERKGFRIYTQSTSRGKVNLSEISGTASKYRAGGQIMIQSGGVRASKFLGNYFRHSKLHGLLSVLRNCR